MRAKFHALTALLALGVILCGCGTPQSRDLQQRKVWAHEERMAQIKAGQMTSKERQDFAEMVADKVVERLKQQRIERSHSD